LRNYNFTVLYDEPGKKLFLYEHDIYCSDYFIKKLRLANHWYIDCTFVVPPDFKQLFVILYRDDFTGKRYPGIYALYIIKKNLAI